MRKGHAKRYSRWKTVEEVAIEESRAEGAEEADEAERKNARKEGTRSGGDDVCGFGAGVSGYQ